jgi:hypothetical protein
MFYELIDDYSFKAVFYLPQMKYERSICFVPKKKKTADFNFFGIFLNPSVTRRYVAVNKVCTSPTSTLSARS